MAWPGVMEESYGSSTHLGRSLQKERIGGAHAHLLLLVPRVTDSDLWTAIIDATSIDDRFDEAATRYFSHKIFVTLLLGSGVQCNCEEKIMYIVQYFSVGVRCHFLQSAQRLVV